MKMERVNAENGNSAQRLVLLLLVLKRLGICIVVGFGKTGLVKVLWKSVNLH